MIISFVAIGWSKWFWLPQKWIHKVLNISRYVLITPQSYRFLRHHCLASDSNLCCRVWFCIRSSISWCAGQTDHALTNSLHIALCRTDCIASCILLHFVDQIILQEEWITLWVALHCNNNTSEMTNTISADDRVTGELYLFQSSSCPQLPDRLPTLLITKLPDGQLTTKLTQVSKLDTCVNLDNLNI